MPGPVKIKVDLSAGTIEVEADAENIDAVFNRLDAFIPRLSNAYERSTYKIDGASNESTPLASRTVTPTPDASGAGPAEKGVEARKVSKGARGKEAYSAVDLGLTEPQRKELRDFFAAKQPKSQHEQVAVLVDWLKREGNKPTVTWNDIFTAFRTVGAKSPAKISSVLGNMVGMSWVKNVGGGQYALIHVGEDFVKFDLPKAKGGEKA